MNESWRLHGLLVVMVALLMAPHARADQHFSREVFFDTSLSPDSYFYSSGRAVAPSVLSLTDGKLPLAAAPVISAPNALKLQWTSAPGGQWSADVRVYQWRNRDLDWAGNVLYLWLWSEQGIAAADLPTLSFVNVDAGSNVLGFERASTQMRPLSDFTGALAPATWTRVRVPMKHFDSSPQTQFNPRRLGTIVLSQGAASDGRPHTLVIDDVRVQADAGASTPPPTPLDLRARGYERHVLLEWAPVEDSGIAHYVIERSLDGGTWTQVGVQRHGVNLYSDYLGVVGANARYRVGARTSALVQSPPSAEAAAVTRAMSDDELLTMVQEASFRYYWDAAEPNSGMARESQPGADHIIATGASGFGIMAMMVAAERGFITRAQAVERMLKITAFLQRADRYHGVWPHFLSGNTGRGIALFQIYDDAADLVETSFLLQGLLAARGYYTGDDPQERELRERITTLWHEVEWDWFRTPANDALYWHWSPNYGFQIANRLEGWNEAMITYQLAIASPTHPVPAELYRSGYTREGGVEPYGVKRRFYDIDLDQVYYPPTAMSPGSPGPLFFTHYSYLGYDPRGVRDRTSNYFRSNRNQSLISQQYAIANPGRFKGYGADSWGLTAVDGPDDQYHEYKPFLTDDGTLAPTGAVSAYAYTPEASLAAIRHWYRDHGAQLWDIYGFRDSFNQQLDWYSGISMGLNQAPQTVMIENGRTGLVWRAFMANPEIRAMQDKLQLVRDQD